MQVRPRSSAVQARESSHFLVQRIHTGSIGRSSSSASQTKTTNIVWAKSTDVLLSPKYDFHISQVYSTTRKNLEKCKPTSSTVHEGLQIRLALTMKRLVRSLIPSKVVKLCSKTTIRVMMIRHIKRLMIHERWARIQDLRLSKMGTQLLRNQASSKQ